MISDDNDIEGYVSEQLEEEDPTAEEVEKLFKQALSEDVDSRNVDECKFTYEHQGNGVYSLDEDEILSELQGFPGVDTIEELSFEVENGSGVEEIGVSKDDSSVTLSQNGGEETIRYIGTGNQESFFKNNWGGIYKFIKQEDSLFVMDRENNKECENKFCEIDDKHQRQLDHKLNKVLESQRHSEYLKRALNLAEEQDWEYDDLERPGEKTNFDYVMSRLVENDDSYTVKEGEYSSTNGARGRDILHKFNENRKRFRVYGMIKYNVDPVEDVEISNDGMSVVKSI